MKGVEIKFTVLAPLVKQFQGHKIGKHGAEIFETVV